MTSEKHLKARIRARTAKTGERYATARRHVVGENVSAADPLDGSHVLRGGRHPAVGEHRNILHHQGRPISEAMVLGSAAASARVTSSGSSTSTGQAPDARLP